MVTLNINGRDVQVDADTSTPILWALRDNLNMTGTKFGCGAALCGACHRLTFLANGYTPDGWHTVVRMMLNFGVPIPKDEVTTVTDYLIKSFPERQRPGAAAIAGPAEVTMKQWAVPTPGSRPHDPMAARDGSIWYTGQLANNLGHIDPTTGAIKEYHTNDQTGPHGLVE